MSKLKDCQRLSGALLFFLVPCSLPATTGGGPLGRTGAFGELGCNECHRNTQGGAGTVTIDVGPYVPGQRQRVIVTINDTGANRWGFQLAARERRNTARQAGSFTPVQDDQFVWVRCAGGTMPPCNNELEYATHTSVGTRLGARAGFVTFRMDWTAPAADVGEVVLTAAGLGADGDLGTNGDRTFTTTAVSLFAASSQPTLTAGGVVNAASFARGIGISPGAIVSLFGDRLAPPNFTREVARSDLLAGRLPTELSRIGVDFVVPPFDPVPGYVLFASDRQINVQTPALLPSASGRAEVQVVFNRGQGPNEVRGNRIEVPVQPVSPGLFTFPDGRSVAAVHSVLPSGAPVGRPGLFPNSRPARPGDVILVFGTGFGPTIPPVEPGSLAEGAAPLAAGVTVVIGGRTLADSDVLYAGAAPSFAGLQQFNLRIPAGLGPGELPLEIRVGGTPSQAGVTVAVEP